jgi:hypothetical protein
MRTIYIHPNELLDIRIIHNADEPLNAKSWRDQLRPRRTLIKIANDNSIEYTDPAMTIAETTIGGKILRYR